MDKVKIIEKLKELNASGVSLSKIEKDNKMPLNCLSGFIKGKKEMPIKWFNQLGEYITDIETAPKYPDGICPINAIVGYSFDISKISIEQFDEFRKEHPQEWVRLSAITIEGYGKTELLKQRIDSLIDILSQNKPQEAPKTESHTNTSQKEKSVDVGAGNASEKAINKLVGIVSGIVLEDNAVKIAQYENEMKHLGEGSLGKLRKKQLEKLIVDLKKKI